MVDPLEFGFTIPYWIVAVVSLLPSLFIGLLCSKVFDFMGFCVGVVLGLAVSLMLGAWVLPYFVYLAIGGVSLTFVGISATLIRSDKHRGLSQ